MDDDARQVPMPPMFAWPAEGDRAYAPGNSLSLQAFPKSLRHSLDLVGESFIEAADLIVAALESEQKYATADLLFHPVAFLYRHYLEVSMKSLLQQGVKLRQISVTEFADLRESHSLYQLWKLTRNLLASVSASNEDRATLENVERIILDFHQRDPKGLAHRYAMNKNHTPFLQTPPEQVCLGHLRDIMKGVHSFFNGCDAQLDDLIGCQPDEECDF